MKKAALLILFLSVLGIGGCFGLQLYTDRQFATADLENGQSLYTTNCAVCHGDKGHGDGLAAENLTPTPDNIYEELTGSLGFNGELVNTVLEGGYRKNGAMPVMPAFGASLSETDVHDIFGYIVSVN